MMAHRYITEVKKVMQKLQIIVIVLEDVQA